MRRMNKHTLRLRTQDGSLAIAFEGTPLLMDVLQAHGIAFAHPCGGRGVCRKCAVEASGGVSPPCAEELESGVRLSCRMRLLGDCEVTLHTESNLTGQTQNGQADGALLAVDVGTTTLEIKLYDSATHALLRAASALNPQAVFAADVIGRITAALSGKGEALRTQLLAAIQTMLGEGVPVERAVITGNTVMLTLLTGRSPKAFTTAPFQPDCLFGYTEQILGFPAYLPRCSGAFTGADLGCALLYSGMTEREETGLLCDIGTNGEIALWHGGKLYVTSTAVGPAFEGAGISSGMGGIPGAVDKVWAAQNTLDARVIGGGEPLGICGSGLVDAVAAMLRLRLIDRTGAMDDPAVTVTGNVTLTRQDIRQVQLAKAAVAAGIELLLEAAGTDVGEIAALYIAGGFGSHLDVRSAAAIGLIPPLLVPKAHVLGNAALEGAGMLLLDEALQTKTDRLARHAALIQLGGNPLFEEKYLKHIDF